jgi:8-oxo-dGTP pyrophosphatase MutT (NUDIX family)
VAEETTAELVCVGALITDPAGRLFVQRRSMSRKLFPGAWDIVGGHVEAGESLPGALRREVREETGWEARIGALAGTLGWVGNDGRRRTEHDYLVEIDGDLAAPRLEVGKHTEFRWITTAELDLLTVARTVDADLIGWLTLLAGVLADAAPAAG